MVKNILGHPVTYDIYFRETSDTTWTFIDTTSTEYFTWEIYNIVSGEYEVKINASDPDELTIQITSIIFIIGELVIVTSTQNPTGTITPEVTTTIIQETVTVVSGQSSNTFVVAIVIFLLIAGIAGFVFYNGRKHQNLFGDQETPDLQHEKTITQPDSQLDESGRTKPTPVDIKETATTTSPQGIDKIVTEEAPTTPIDLFCGHCGTRRVSASQFCMKCGEKF